MRRENWLVQWYRTLTFSSLQLRSLTIRIFVNSDGVWCWSVRYPDGIEVHGRSASQDEAEAAATTTGVAFLEGQLDQLRGDVWFKAAWTPVPIK